MAQLQISDLASALQLAPTWATKTLSLLDYSLSPSISPQVLPRWGWPVHPNHKILFFDDIDRAMLGYVAPSMVHLEAAFDFAKTLLPDDKVLVHCHAGISRSTAMSMFVLIAAGLIWREAFSVVEQTRPQMHPNRLIVQLTDQHFGFGGEFVEHVAHWKNDVAYRITAQQGPTQGDISAMQRLKDMLDKTD